MHGTVGVWLEGSAFDAIRTVQGLGYTETVIVVRTRTTPLLTIVQRRLIEA